MRLSLMLLTLALAACGPSEKSSQQASANEPEMNLDAENFDEAAMVDSGTDYNASANVVENQ